MSAELVKTIELNGGRVFTKARVAELILSTDNTTATGVLLVDGTELHARHAVISTIGLGENFVFVVAKSPRSRTSIGSYDNTYGKLLPDGVAAQHHIPLPVPKLASGAGFVSSALYSTTSSHPSVAPWSRSW
jgi:hypothetical protein